MLWASSRKRYACKGHHFNALSYMQSENCPKLHAIAVHYAHPAPQRVERDFVQVHVHAHIPIGFS